MMETSITEKLDNILKDVLKEPVAFFPIRHHSPACSFHLKNAIELYAPDCVLIEGPCDTDNLIPCLIQSEPPVSIYYSYSDSDGKHACYYPMLEYSPELVAVKEASAKNIPVHFIDLPYGNMVLERRKNDGAKSRDTYYNEYFLRHSKYIALLCERENCKGYNELWEKLFELSVSVLTTEEFIRNLTALCFYSRIDYPEELLKEEQNPQREAFMAENIIKYSKKYKRVFVVTGGFHTSELIELIRKGKPDKIKPVSGQAYLIPYSFEESDRLTGYESGMPYPGFYQSFYNNLTSGETNAGRKTVLEYTARLAKKLRLNRESISLSEEAAAFSMCIGLADLRGKSDIGVYEFLDGVRSAFVKGELNLSTSFILKQTTELLRGVKIGKVGSNAPVPPIVVDFMNVAKSYKMDINSSITKTLTLNIVTKKQHRRQSVFLHRLNFLENPYARKTYGPDYEKRKNTKLIREKWDLAFSGKVTSALIEKSHLGGTVAEACESMLSEMIKNNCNCASDAAGLIIKAGIMELFEHAEKLLDIVLELINDDHSFISLAECIKSLSFLQGVENILRIDKTEQIEAAKLLSLKRIIPMLNTLTAADEKEDFNLAQQIKNIHQIASNENFIDMDYFNSSLSDLLESRNIPPSVDGAVSGLLSVGDYDFALHRALKYLNASGDTLKMSGRFLRGLFLTAKDVVFYGDVFLNGINEAVKKLTYDEFLETLPDLRLAFTFFTPSEIDLISKNVLKMLGLTEEHKINLPVIDEKELKIIKEVDRRATDYMKEKKFLATS